MSRSTGLRRAVRRAGPRGRGRRLPDQLRQQLQAEAARLARQGEPISGIAEALGISASSVRRWRAVSALKTPRLVPVEICKESAREPLASVPTGEEPGRDPLVRVVAPSGWRIEGIDLETAVRLLQALA